jgi:hypothetical protein
LHSRHGKVCVGERGVGQAEAELELRGDLVAVKVAVVDEKALGEVLVWVGVERDGRVEEVGAVVGFGYCYSVGEAARGVDVAVEERGEGVAGFLAWEAGEEGGGYVGVGDPGRDGADSWFG